MKHRIDAGLAAPILYLAAFLLAPGLAAASPQFFRSQAGNPVPAGNPVSSPVVSGATTGSGQIFFVSGGNDDCASASLILGTGPYFGSNVGATTDGPAACGSFGADVWYEWICPATGSVTISLCNAGTNYDTTLAVYSGGCGGSLVSCNDTALVCLHGGTYSTVSFAAVEGTSYRIRIGGASGATGDFEMRISLPTHSYSDACATPDPISGPGPHAFDLSVATTGPEGQGNAACLSIGTMAIASDIWFTWTAPASGPTTVETCGQTGFNTKIGVYLGSGCPAGAPLGCNNDACGVESAVTFAAVKDQAYTIQMGVHPGSPPLVGTFTILGPQPPNTCTHDDGISDDAGGLGASGGGEQAILHRYGAIGDETVVHSMSLAFGSPLDPGTAPPPGTLVVLSIFDDPNDDGVPDDLVRLATVSSVIHSVDLDSFAAAAFPSPVFVSGVYFAVASITSGAGEFPLCLDDSVASSGRAWIAAQILGGIRYDDLPGSSLYGELDALGIPGVWLLRVDCEPRMESFCFPGTGGVLACPCGQPANPSGGCANFGATATSGAVLTGSGVASLAADTVVLTTSNHRTAPAAGILNVFFTGKGPPTSGIASNAGVRCVGVSLKRLYSGNTTAGALSKPGMGDDSVSDRSTALGVGVLSGESRYYFNVYRDNGATGAAACNDVSKNTNLTNAVRITWGP